MARQSLRNFSALSKGETFRILYNKRKYDIGVVEVQPESGTFPPGAPQVRAIGPSSPPPRRHRVLILPQAVCIIETDINLDFDAPADYVEPERASSASVSPAPSPLDKSPILRPLPPPVLDGDSSDDESAKPAPFASAGFRLDGKPIKSPKKSLSPAGAGASAAGNGGAVRVGVRIGASGELTTAPLGGDALAGGVTLGGGQTLGGGGGAAANGGLTLNGRPSGGGQSAAPASAAAPAAANGDDYWARFSGGGNTLR